MSQSITPALQISTERLLSQKAVVMDAVRRAARWITERNVAMRQARRLKVNATVALPNKSFVAVIQCDGCEFLVGSSGTTMTLLASLPEAAENGTSRGHEVIA